MNIDTATIRKLAAALLHSGRRPSTVVSSAYQTLTRLGLLGDAELKALAQVDPVAETMFLMMAADGRLDPSERVAIRGAIRGLTADLLQDGIVDTMLVNYQTGLAKDGRDARLQRIAASFADSTENAEGAFALAAAVALSDEHVDPAEMDLVLRLATWFGIPKDRSTVILDQLEEKPRG